MELSGDEKRIQALFSELRVADERIAPRFNAFMNRTESALIRAPRGFNLSLAWAAVLIFAIAALAWWGAARFLQTTSSSVVATTPSTANAGSPAVVREPSDETDPVRPGNTGSNSGSKFSSKNRSQLLARRLTARRRAEMLAANKKVLEDASAISKWASPTVSLLSSSSDEVLTSLPQLNQNANQLKSFLPSSSN